MLFLLDFLVGLAQGDAKRWHAMVGPLGSLACAIALAVGAVLITRDSLVVGAGVVVLAVLVGTVLLKTTSNSASDASDTETEMDHEAVRARAERERRVRDASG